MTKHAVQTGLSSKTILILVLISAIPRIILALLNSEVNDDHITTVLLWYQNGEFPSARDCWECFQPPLFYFIVKIFSTVAGSVTYENVFNVIQSFNLLISIGIAWLSIIFISRLQLNRFLSISLALFWVLNPELISIGVLVTNDSLVILLGILFSLKFLDYLDYGQWQKEVVLSFLLFLLGITKGNGLLFIGIAPIVILIKTIYTKQFLTLATLRKFTLLVTTVVAIAYSGLYIEKYQEFNNPFITNVNPPYEKAKWDTPGTFKFRKGVNTIKETLFSFPIFSLIQTPYNLNEVENNQLTDETYGRRCLVSLQITFLKGTLLVG